MPPFRHAVADDKYVVVPKPLMHDIAFGKLASSQRPREASGPGPFQLLSTLQSGSIGKAVVVRELGVWPEDRILCLKVISKNNISKNQEKWVLAELASYKRLASVPKRSICAFVMGLDGALQDRDNLYLGMSLLCHDLLGELTKDVGWRRKAAKKWLAELVMGVSFIHDAGIIHRDIKPENVLVDFHGDIRICDFGCAYLHNDQPLRSRLGYSCDVIGTWEYMAPEMLENKDKNMGRPRNYGLAVDYWGIGCVFFELVTQPSVMLFPKDKDRIRYENWDKDVHGKSFFSTWELGEHIQDVLEALTNFEPDERCNIRDLVEHPYFRDENGKSSFFRPLDGHPWPRPSTIVEPDLDPSEKPMQYSPSVTPPPDAEPFEEFGWINPNGIWAGLAGQER